MFDANDSVSSDNGWLISEDGAVAIAEREEQPMTLAETLFENGCDFDFFQAVSILEAIHADRQPVGILGRNQPAVRFAAHASSTSFAASSIYEISPATTEHPTARMVVSFLGLTGPAGILPQNYSEILRQIEFESRDPEKFALREWLDLFNDRTISMFYRSWKKYRPAAFYGKALQGGTDPFTKSLQSLCGLGLPSQSRQVRKFIPRLAHEQNPTEARSRDTVQLALMRYVGLVSQRPRCATNLEQLLMDYFGLPVEVQQFHGNWLYVGELAQTRLGLEDGNCILGQNAIVGDQTWERQNKILIEIGPVGANQFMQFMPDHQSPYAENDFQLLVELIRLYVGPEMEFDIRLKLRADSIPAPQLSNDPDFGMRLGWNTWLPGHAQDEPVSETLFCIDD